jgi:hypothetical protein
MIGSIFFKEFIKIRWKWLTLVAANALLMGYVAMETRGLFVADHSEIVWYRTMQLGLVYYGELKYVPVIVGLLLACVQYLPETAGERLRLSLHLPVSPHMVVLAHIWVGCTAVGLIVAFDLVALAAITARYFPPESVAMALSTALPWGIAGFVAYLGGALALLEPSYRHGIFNLAVAAGVCALFLRSSDPGGYGPALPWLASSVPLMIPAVLLPAYRFRFRRTDR